MAEFKPPTRDELARVFGDNPSLIRKIEKLFEQAGVDLPENVSEIEQSVALESSSLSGLLASIMAALEGQPINGPIPQQIAPSEWHTPQIVPTIEGLSDLSTSGKVAGVVIYFDAVTGWKVKILDASDLSDISVSAPSDGQVLTYNAAASQFENADAATPTGASGNFTSVDAKTVTVTNGIITAIT
jgi:hypothetical protein